ncbi:Rne/Rng family ribonuclease [Actinopolymorpha alba]|uniref:Rne/Rng family ribonuclease n=1 Tax=Actinopolymorpha alba TaxID=533267 RepID=UPI00035EB0B7|nr:Rne/Rng family ribonuclease [Actinopolymorpha alba]
MLEHEQDADTSVKPEQNTELSAEPAGSEQAAPPAAGRKTTRKRTSRTKSIKEPAETSAESASASPAASNGTEGAESGSNGTNPVEAPRRRSRTRKATAASRRKGVEPDDSGQPESRPSVPPDTDAPGDTDAAGLDAASEPLQDETPHTDASGAPGSDVPPVESRRAPAVPVVAFQPPTVLFQSPAIEAAQPEKEEDRGEPSASRRRRGRSGGTPEADESPVTVTEAEEPQGEPEAEVGTDDDGDGDGDEGGRRRRRRRGGRRRNKSGGDEEAADERDEDAHEADEEAAGTERADDGDVEAGEADADTGAGEDEDEDEASTGSRRRRRRRRRRGESVEPSPDDPEVTVVKVREPRKADDEVTILEGSTRLEAKKQRRREGREAGRRRPPILTEAEFLARREAVDRTMVIRQHGDRTQIAVLEDDVLVEHYVTRESQSSMIGNVYLGRVQNVLPSMEAAFIDIGRGRNAVLYAGEVDWNGLGREGHPKRIEAALKSGQPVLVQVTKDPVGHKGARLTSQISIPGRYLVYVPHGSMNGISRKLPDVERNRLKQLLKEIVPDEAGVVVRTAAEGASEEELSRDVSRLQAQWEAIEKKATNGQAPNLLYSEPDLLIKVVRDLFTEDFSRLVVAGDEAWDMVEGYVDHVAPHLADRLERWNSPQDAFTTFRIDEQIMKALDRKVWLPSGGSLIIDRTEAMTVIDVNTGKFTGAGGNLEETVTKNNLEAAEEIVRQLRLRDIGGIIVVDFIDMVLESNRDLVLRRLVECLGRDRTKHQVAEVTSLGLVQMTRKRIGTGLLESFSEPCEACNGRGVKVRVEPAAASAPTPAPAEEDGHRRSRRRRRGGGGGSAGHPEAAESESESPAVPEAPEGGESPDLVASASTAVEQGGTSEDGTTPPEGAEQISPREGDASASVVDAPEPAVEPVEPEPTAEKPGAGSGERSSRRRGRRRAVSVEQ